MLLEMNQKPNVNAPLGQPSLIELGQLIKRARKGSLGLSREVFAARIGCSAVTLDSLEDGAAGVGVGLVMAALAAIGADARVVATVSSHVAMLEIASKPIDFPAPR